MKTKILSSAIALALSAMLTTVPQAIAASDTMESYQFSYEDETEAPSTFDEVGDMGDYIYSIESAKATFCQCVDYIKNRYGFSCSTNAKDMGSCLIKNQFKKLSSPLAGAIIIFQPNYGGGIDKTYGHIGVITNISYSSKQKKYTLKVRGANQGGKVSTEYKCNNVSDLSTTYTVGSSRDKNLSFYAK